jgi:hypothetical protein
MTHDTASYRCPNCLKTIRVLADEYGDQPCSNCGWGPEDGNEISEGDDAE